MSTYVILVYLYCFLFFKQKTAYEMRISDWSSDVCSSDLPHVFHTALSRAMRADALVQFLVWKKWTDLFLLAGDTAGDQAYAEAIHRAAKKFGAEIVAEEGYAYDPIARDRKTVAEGIRLSVRCDLGGHRNHNKKTKTRT